MFRRSSASTAGLRPMARKAAVSSRTSTDCTEMRARTRPYATATPSAAEKATRNGERGASGRPGRPNGLSSSTCASMWRTAVSSTGSSGGATRLAADTAAALASRAPVSASWRRPRPARPASRDASASCADAPAWSRTSPTRSSTTCSTCSSTRGVRGRCSGRASLLTGAHAGGGRAGPPHLHGPLAGLSRGGAGAASAVRPVRPVRPCGRCGRCGRCRAARPSAVRRCGHVCAQRRHHGRDRVAQLLQLRGDRVALARQLLDLSAGRRP